MKKQSNLSRLLEIAGSHKYLTYASWVLSAISALIALVPFYYIWKMIKEVLEVAPNFGQAQSLTGNGWMAVLFAVIAVLVYIAGLMCSHLGAFRIATNLRIQTMEHIVKLPLGFAESFGSGKLRKIVNESSAATETYLAHQLPDRANAIATPCGLLVLLFVFDWRLGLLSLVPVVLGFLIMMAMTGKQMQEKMKEYQNALDDMSNEAVEYVRGIPVVKTFGQTIFSFKKFKDSIDRYKVWVIAYTKQLRTPMMFYTAAINGVFVFLIAGALLFTQDQVTTEFLLNLVFYIIITPIISVTLTRIMFQSENAMIVDDALQRIDSVLNLEPLKETAHPMHPKDGSVELEQVHFSYNGEKDVLNGISISIPAGQTVAFVGPSGGGKTTLVNLLPRFYDVKSGNVLIDGRDVRDIDLVSLRDKIAVVFQDNFLFAGTIRENILLGKEDATPEQIDKAVKSACLDEFIRSLERGLDTQIGERGVLLSGGQKQRIAIARAFIKDAPVVILDEATSALDNKSEAVVQQAIENLMKDRTVLIIAHRLSTVRNADKIVVVNYGEIAEIGSHEQLINKENSIYASLYKTQLK